MRWEPPSLEANAVLHFAPFGVFSQDARSIMPCGRARGKRSKWIELKHIMLWFNTLQKNHSLFILHDRARRHMSRVLEQNHVNNVDRTMSIMWARSMFGSLLSYLHSSSIKEQGHKVLIVYLCTQRKEYHLVSLDPFDTPHARACPG